jgi:hypothetical protein
VGLYEFAVPGDVAGDPDAPPGLAAGERLLLPPPADDDDDGADDDDGHVKASHAPSFRQLMSATSSPWQARHSGQAA